LGRIAFAFDFASINGISRFFNPDIFIRVEVGLPVGIGSAFWTLVWIFDEVVPGIHDPSSMI
jgi:hypothetical protein